MRRILLLLMIFFLISFISAAPNITDISITPENPTFTDTIKICASIIDNLNDIILVRINLHSENPIWNWGFIMDKEEEKYCKILSSRSMGAYEGKNISYYISARNNLGELTTTETYYFSYRGVSFCGDGICDKNENCSICSEDCGICPPESESRKRSHKSSSYQPNFELFCEPNWKCSGWSECKNGLMTRQCYDSNHCDYAYNRPIEETGCEMTSKALIEKNSSNWGFILFGIITPLILIIILIVVVSVRRK